MSEEGHYFCKIDLKALFYCVPLEQKTQRNTFELLFLCFGLGFAQILTKQLKMLIALFRKYENNYRPDMDL